MANNANISSWGRLWRLIRLNKSEISSIYITAILNGLIQLCMPLGIQAIIGFSLGATIVTSIYVLVFLVVLSVLLVGLLQMTQMKLIERIQQRIFTTNAIDLSEKIPRMDLGALDKYYLPEKVNRFFETFNIQKGLSKILLDIPIASIQIVFGLILLSFYHSFFIAFGAFLLFILWLILRFTAKQGLATAYKESNHKYIAIAWIEEMARVIKSLKFSQGSHLNLKKTDKNTIDYLESRNAHFNILLIQYQILIAFKVIIIAAMLVMGTYLLLEQRLNVGEFIAAEIVIISVMGAIEKLISSLDNIYDVATGLEKMEGLLEVEEEKDGKIQWQNDNSGPNINLVNFSFGYPDLLPLFKDVTTNFNKNKIIAITGMDSAGKSTLIKILSTYYKNYDGNILIDDIAFKNYSLKSLRDNIGSFVPQQEVFDGSLLENITMGKDIDTQEVIQLMDKLQFKNLLNTMPEGLDTELDPDGKKISSNHTNKILLLRALIHKPKLVLLDEPFLNLGVQESVNIVQYLKSITYNTTIIIATTDNYILDNCDEVYTIKNQNIIKL